MRKYKGSEFQYLAFLSKIIKLVDIEIPTQ